MEGYSNTPKETNKQVIVVRHATSYANIEKRRLDQIGGPEARKAVGRDINYLDPLTVPESENEIHLLAEKFKSLKVKVWFVSPMRRTMHTAFGILKDHPEFENIQFVLTPLLMTTLKSTWNTPIGSLQSIKAEYEEKYPGISIDTIDMKALMEYPEWHELLTAEMENDPEFVSIVEEILYHPENYYMNYFKKKLRKRILKFMHEKHLNNEKPHEYLKDFKSIKIFEYLLVNHPAEYVEKKKRSNKRTKIFKEYLCRTYNWDNFPGPQKILIVSHNQILKGFVGYCNTGKFDETMRINNAQALEASLRDMKFDRLEEEYENIID